MERKTPVKRAQENLSWAEEILETVIYITDPESTFHYPKAFAELRLAYNETLKNPKRPQSTDYYETRLKIGETFLKILSSSPGRDWSGNELTEIAGILDFDEFECKSELWNLVWMGILEWNPDRTIRISDDLK